MLRTVSVIATTVVLALGTMSVTQADKSDPPPEPTSAHAALAAAQDLFRDDGTARGEARDGRDATLVLRDLALARDQLTGADRAAAERILARPTDGPPAPDGYTTRSKRLCSADVCVHWVKRTDDAVPLADDDGDRKPDYVETALATLQHVHSKYAAAGYREPLPDGTLGGDARTDIYLANVGDRGLYGYCRTDQDIPDDRFDVWAYCVLDNDYRKAEFPTNTPLENLKVTAAHEYYHAVQFAYDVREDGWFMEATATWAEDELYDKVNDNVQYLTAGPLGRPHEPLDFFDGNGHQYGSWIFFRYLTERMGASKAGMPTLVRDMWRRADSTQGAAENFYSIQAVRNVLGKRGAEWTRTFTRFVEAGRRSRRVYDEGRGQRYPTTPLATKPITLSADQPSSGTFTGHLNHLASAHVRFVPGRTLTNRRWRLRIRVDMADEERGSSALVTVHRRHGRPDIQKLRLNSKGDGDITVPFSRHRVEAVELSLVNASTRFRDCGQGTPYSCGGWSEDDFLGVSFRGTAVR